MNSLSAEAYGDGVTESPAVRAGAWRDLLGSRYLGISTVLAGGVLLYATNELITIRLLPIAVAYIGGQRFYAWVTPVYLVASVVAATIKTSNRERESTSSSTSRRSTSWRY